MPAETGAAATDAYVATLGEPAAGVAREAAKKLRAILPNAHESVADGDVGFGVEPGYRGLVFTLTPQPDGVLLGFANGATLNDPVGLLEGRGKGARFVRLGTKADLERAALDRLLKEAAKRRAR